MRGLFCFQKRPLMVLTTRAPTGTHRGTVSTKLGNNHEPEVHIAHSING